MPRALTQEETETFEAIREAGNVALIQVTYRGEETSAIAFITEDGEGDYFMVPVAILTTEAMFADIEPPTSD